MKVANGAEVWKASTSHGPRNAYVAPLQSGESEARERRASLFLLLKNVARLRRCDQRIVVSLQQVSLRQRVIGGGQSRRHAPSRRRCGVVSARDFSAHRDASEAQPAAIKTFSLETLQPECKSDRQ